MCGGEALCSVAEQCCNHMDLWDGKDIAPVSECSEKERNERMNESSCVGLAMRCERKSEKRETNVAAERTRQEPTGK